MTQATLNRHADFNRLWAGQTISNFGDKISMLALPTVAIVVLGGGPFEVGVLGTLRFLPFFLLGPVAGLVADRFSRRSVMIAADLGRMLVMGTIPLAFLVDGVTMVHLYVVAGLVGIMTTFFEVSYQSYLPQLVGTQNLVEGNTKLQISRSVAEVAGAGAGGVLMQFLGAARAVAVDSLTFLVSLIALLLIKHRVPNERNTGERTSASADLKEGLRVLLGTPILRSLLVSSTVVNLGAAMGDALLLVYAYKRLGLSPGQVGLAAAVGGVMVIAGAILSGKVAQIFTLGRTLIIMAVALGAGYALLPSAGAIGALVGLIAIQAAIGFVSPIFDIHVLSLVQGVTPNELMGRVGGASLSIVWGALSLGYALGGIVGETVGIAPGLVIAGVITAIGGLTLLSGPVSAIKQQPGEAEAQEQAQAQADNEAPAKTVGVGG